MDKLKKNNNNKKIKRNGGAENSEKKKGGKPSSERSKMCKTYWYVCHHKFCCRSSCGPEEEVELAIQGYTSDVEEARLAEMLKKRDVSCRECKGMVCVCVWEPFWEQGGGLPTRKLATVGVNNENVLECVK